MTYTFTYADLDAYHLLRGGLTAGIDGKTITDAGNKIIALAERIKAERSVVAMQGGMGCC